MHETEDANDCSTDAEDPGRKYGSSTAEEWQTIPESVVKSAGRAIQIFEYFDDIKRAANMVEVARALNYPESSTSILLKSLTTLGYLSYDRYRRDYIPTHRIRLLGNWVDEALFKENAIIRLMKRLSSETSDSIILASRNGMNSQYVHVIQASTALRLHLTIGAMRPLLASITGRIMVSDLEDSEISKLVRRANAETEDPAEYIDSATVHESVAEIRANGYLFGESQVTEGAAVLAMRIPKSKSQSPMAIAIGGPAERMNSRREMLIECLSRAIQGEL